MLLFNEAIVGTKLWSAAMLSVIVEIPSWQSWSVPIAMVLSLGAGIVLGRRLAAGRLASSSAAAGTNAEQESDDAASGEFDWRDLRSSPRFNVRSSHVLVAEAPDAEKTMEGVLLDRSLGGLGLSVERQFPSGIVLHVLLTTNEQQAWVPVEVRYCRLERGRWRLGCKFVESAPTSECKPAAPARAR